MRLRFNLSSGLGRRGSEKSAEILYAILELITGAPNNAWRRPTLTERDRIKSHALQKKLPLRLFGRPANFSAAAGV